jgi:hypothetical protein
MYTIFFLHRRPPSLLSTHCCQRVDPLRGHINQNVAYVFRDVAPEKICDGAFWFMLYRLLCFPSATTNAAALYGSILPWLTGVPLGAQRDDGSGGAGAASASESDTAAAAGGAPSKPKRRWSAIGAPSSQAGSDGNNNDDIEWRRPPLSSDSSRCYCILETMFHVSCCLGCSVSQADATLVIVKAHIMRMLYLDLHAEGPTGDRLTLSNSEALLIRAACKQMAHDAATVEDPEDLSRPFLEHLLALLLAVEKESGALALATNNASRLSLVSRSAAGLALPVSPTAVGDTALTSSSSPSGAAALGPLEGPTCLPLWGRLRRDVDVEKWAGSARVPAIVLPVEMSLVANQVLRAFGSLC